MEQSEKLFENIEQKELNPSNGIAVLFLIIFGLLATTAGIIGSAFLLDEGSIVLGVIIMVLSIILMTIFCIMFAGLKVVGPNEALVLTLFGKYYGTIMKTGFFYVNPFVSAVNPNKKPAVAFALTGISLSSVGTQSKEKTNSVSEASGSKISLKIQTLNNEKQKVNDELGNPIIIGAVVIWKVIDPTKAVFNVENYTQYLSTQCDSTIRNTARLYPYDTMEDGTDERTLRGSSQAIAADMKVELQEKVQDAGLEIVEVRITHLSYAEEIAAAMLQRQQATAIIAARQKIVEGAVSMVKMAIDQLNEDNVVNLDEERKAAMVSNLLVVLCGNKDAQPIVNSGSIY